MKKDTTFNLDDAMKRLEAIESDFRQPKLDLEASLQKHKDATKLAEEILLYLDQAEQNLERIDIASITRTTTGLES